MKNRRIKAALFLKCFFPAIICLNVCNAQKAATPDKLYGQLFQDVQIQRIFPDGKTFVDCIPKRSIKDILRDYATKKDARSDLKNFVETNFILPAGPPQLNYVQQEKNLSLHINNLWGVLTRKADPPGGARGSSLLPLPYPYVVPGGRFREIYYWDSYFTMLGLKESGDIKMLENMVKNFAYLVKTFGHIPNGNRNYYLSRSQPPFFSMMVELLATVKGSGVYKTYLPAMEKEYNYWMEGAGKLKIDSSFKHVTKLSDGSILNRYWDEELKPRQESYKEDRELAEASANELAKRIKVASPQALKKILDDNKTTLCRNLRSAAESGWDFSSRWFADGQQITSIQTTNIVPVDLNCLLYTLEMNIAKAKKLMGQQNLASTYEKKAGKRKAAILKYCWNEQVKFFVDYNAAFKQPQAVITAAGFFPLFIKIATPAQASDVEVTGRAHLLKDGGIVTTTSNTGQQWDAPNGWAPLQWIAVKGLANYEQNDLATDVAKRWLSLNEKVYAATGKLMEKYNVEDITKESGGGEYPSQDGFGWTNGVYLALKKIYGSN
ncbi:MAG: alpha,alpha-trehalase TreA [Ferruginibacter sp.]